MQGQILFKNIKINRFYQYIVDINGIRFHYDMFTLKYLVDAGKASPSLLEGDLSEGMEITRWTLTRQSVDGTLLRISNEKSLPVDFDTEFIRARKQELKDAPGEMSEDMLSKCMQSINELKLEAIIKAFEKYITDNF